MKTIKIITRVSVLLMSSLTLLSCKNKEKQYDDNIRKVLAPIRINANFNLSSEKMIQRDFYNVVYRKEFDKVKEYLEAGVDPNYCHGECGWVDSNPLMVVAESFYDTYWRTYRGESIPDPIPDVATLEALVAGGADLNMRPYIWDRVYLYSNEDLNRLWGSVMVDDKPIGVEKDMKEYYVRDANRIIEAFLKAGADPDMLGHPYPFSYEALKARITDEQAREYFAKGTRPINEAIVKGMAWESQVDLLLQYTTLDEESLKAAESSNDPKMIEKIQKLWKKQKVK